MKYKRFRIKAKLSFYTTDQGGKQKPVHSRYTPVFHFMQDMGTSGMILFSDREKVHPGDELEVDVIFATDKYLGDDLRVGKEFTFSEGREKFGKGIVTQIHGYEGVKPKSH